MAIVAVLFGGHAGDALEKAVEGGGFGKAEHVGRFLKRRRGAGLNEPLGLCRHVLLYPLARRETASSCADDLAEVLGGDVHQTGVVFDFSRLPIVFHHQIAEAVEKLCMAVL